MKNGWCRNTILNESDREVTVVGECLKLRFLKVLAECVKENILGWRDTRKPQTILIKMRIFLVIFSSSPRKVLEKSHDVKTFKNMLKF